MANKADFTSNEWAELLKAPGWASLAVVAASPSGPIGVMKEMFAAGKILADAKQGAKNPLVSALIADFTAAGPQQAQPAELSGKSPEEIRGLAVTALKRVASLVDAKAGSDAEGFKRCLQIWPCGSRRQRRRAAFSVSAERRWTRRRPLRCRTSAR